MAEVLGVSDAKQILLRFASAVDAQLQQPSRVNEQVAQLQGPSAKQQHDSSDCFTTDLFRNPGNLRHERVFDSLQTELSSHDLCVTKCER